MKIESIDLFYLSMPEVLDIGDGSQDALLARVRAGDYEGWGGCEASPLTTIASFVEPMSHSACKPVRYYVEGRELNDVADIKRRIPNGPMPHNFLAILPKRLFKRQNFRLKRVIKRSNLAGALLAKEPSMTILLICRQPAKALDPIFI